MKPKDQDPKDNKSGIIYSYQCNHLDCDEEYIGETARTTLVSTTLITYGTVFFLIPQGLNKALSNKVAVKHR